MNTHYMFPRLLFSLLVMIFITACGGSDDNSVSYPPLSSDISISATVALDVSNSLDASVDSTQSGTLAHVSGSQPATATFTNSPSLITPNTPLTGGITHVNDGIGTRFIMSGNWNGSDVTTDGIFSDYTFTLENFSTTDSLRVTFRADFTNTVMATGANAYAYADLSVRGADNNELFFTEQRVDNLSTSNNLDENHANNIFSIDLTPGTAYQLTALQRQRGGVLATGNYNASLDTFILVQSVEKII